MPDQPIVLLSGLGADERLLVLQRLRFPSLIVPRWIEPIPNETLRDYSKRMAATIEPQDNMILGGVSMGGMVALEIAQILKLRGVVLIAACYTPSEIASWVRTVAAVGRVTPAFFGDHIRKFAELGMSAMGVREPAHKAVVLEIAKDVSFKFARWAASAILDWPGVAPLALCPVCPVLRIHGSRDHMIRCPVALAPAGQTNVLIAGAGHVLNLTHAGEVNNAITAWLEVLNRS